MLEDAFRPLSAFARVDDDVIFTTQPGDQLGFFAADPPPRPPRAVASEGGDLV